MKMRRVVTGDVDGRSAFVADEQLEVEATPFFNGIGFHSIWGDDDIPSLPSDGTLPARSMYLPGARGFRFISVTHPPKSHPPLPDDMDLAAAAAEADLLFPGLAGVHDEEGWHTTDSIDIFIIIKGQVTLVLDEGERILGPGDVYVQNGTRHRWVPTSEEPCQMVGVLIGAHRAG